MSILGWDEPDWDFDKKPKRGRRRPDEPDKDGIYPVGMGPVLRARDRYSYPEFYLYRAGGKHNAGIYSDRLMQWDWDKFNRCCREVWDNEGQSFSQRAPEEIERFLRLYYDDEELKLVDIIEGCNRSNGYPYWAFRVFMTVDPNEK